jgi:hypothetical protein
MIDDTKRALTSEFSDVFDVSGPLRTMAEPPMRIVLREDAVPFSIHRTRPIPFAQRVPVKAALDKLVEKKVIALVTGPTDWINSQPIPWLQKQIYQDRG